VVKSGGESRGDEGGQCRLLLMALNRKEMPMLFSRRTFLKTVAAALASLLLPPSPRAERRPRFWFLRTETGDSWPVTDPVAWSLDNTSQPILERARERLVALDATDPQRVIRLITRRCKLNLIELRPGEVIVHYWGQQGQANLRPFFKAHSLTGKGVRVTLIDRKREASTHLYGHDFLYGEPISPFWPLNARWLRLYWKKWQRRHVEDSDDGTAAPGTHSGFGWEGIEPHGIPWAALKSAWRRIMPMVCPNCDVPTLLVNFGLPQCGFCNREARFVHGCRQCHRLFRDYSIDRFEVETWMVSNLDAEVLPGFILWMGKPVKWKPPPSDGASEPPLRSTSDTKTA
jgi:hypothetical protein